MMKIDVIPALVRSSTEPGTSTFFYLDTVTGLVTWVLTMGVCFLHVALGVDLTAVNPGRGRGERMGHALWIETMRCVGMFEGKKKDCSVNHRFR